MQNMETKVSISRVHLAKGEYFSIKTTHCIGNMPNLLFFCRFGWVNASYVYGLEILNAHMRRSLGAITPYETYRHAMEQSDDALS